MSYISYTALRELELSGFSKSGTDISASASDDSFNSSSTSLTGLLLDQWINVAGFASAANNGWFQAKSDSTINKILQVTPPIAHLRLPGVAGNYASTPDSVAASVLGNIELMAKAALTDWTPAAINVFIAKDDGATNRDYSLAMDSGSTGKLVFLYTSDGSTTAGRVATSSVAVGFADLAVGWVKVTYNSSTGVVKFYTSTDGTVFNQLGTDVTLTSGAIHNGTSTLAIGANSAGNSPMNGRLHYAEVRNGIGGSIAAAFDASLGLRNGTSITAPTGEVWTVNTSGSPAAAFQGRAPVTVSASPLVTMTGYKRGYGQAYSLDFYSEKVDRSVKVIRNTQQPIGGGSPEVMTQRREVYFDVSVVGRGGDMIDEVDMPQWREFLASVEGGETFTFDRYGTSLAPVDPRPVMLATPDYMEERISSTRKYRLMFQVRDLS